MSTRSGGPGQASGRQRRASAAMAVLGAAAASVGLVRLRRRRAGAVAAALVQHDRPAGRARLVVEVGELRVGIEQSPFRLLVHDADGRLVLSSVDDRPTAGRRRWPLPDPPPLGLPLPDQPPLYAPFTFLLGTDRVLQHRVGPWVGNIVAGVRAGVEHALLDVLSHEVTPSGVLRLVVSTTDPAGRRAIVTIGPDVDASEAIAIRVELSPTDRVASVAAAFRSPADEALHGFGGRRNATDQRGRRVVNWCEEYMQRPDPFAWVARLPGFDDRWQFPSGPDSTYYVQPLFISSRGYGLWVTNDERSRFRLAVDRDDAWHVNAAAPQLELVVAPGDAPTAVATLTSITGRNPVPPAWALGPMLSRAVELTGVTPERYERQVLDDLDAVEQHALPITAFAVEGWPMLVERGSWPSIVARMRARGIRPVTYLKTFVGGDARFEDPRLSQEAVEEGLVATDRRGRPYRFGSPLGLAGIAMLLDPTRTATIRWWQRRVRDALDAGAEGFMQDFGEQALEAMRFADGSTGAQLHNRYPVLLHRATREAMDAYVADHPDREPWFFVRSGYTGRPGSAAYEPTSWGGDATADWSRASGIGSVIPDLLNRGLGGAYGYTTDIAGYIDAFGSPDEELFVRWAQLAALLPCHRVHGSPFHGTSMPWSYGERALACYRASVELHLRARPLLLDLWDGAVRTGAPICRPLWWHHPDDRRARSEEQQWLLGPDVLVAPVIERGASSRRIYLPTGRWRDPDAGTMHEGPGELVVPAPLERLPYLVRDGAEPFTTA